MRKNHITGFGFSEKDLNVDTKYHYKYIKESGVARDAYGKAIQLRPFNNLLDSIHTA